MIDQGKGATLVALLEAAAQAAGVALLAVDDDGVVLALSGGFVELWGLPRDAAASKSIADVLDALRTGNEMATKAASLIVAAPTRGRGELASEDGRVVVWGLEYAAEARAKVWTFREVSQERNAVRALRDAENWLRMFAAHADGAVLELDGNARIIGLWAGAGTFFERSEALLQGQTLHAALPEPQASYFEERVRSVLVTGRPESFEYALESGEERRVFAANAVLLPEHEGYPTTATALVRDVTERARLQQQLLQAERLASLGVLAAGVAHEINNPLGYMLLNLQHVRRVVRQLVVPNDRSLDDDSEDVAARYVRRTADAGLPAAADLFRCIDMTIEGALRVEAIVQDLRRFSRSDPDEPLVELDVRRVLAFTLDMTRPVVEERARVVREFGEVPSVLASEGRLNQVFLNLVLNAAQAIPERAPDQEIRLRTHTDERGRAVVEVRDTGVGISEAHIRKIFDPFFTTKASGVGTGLGLAICHGITTSFGGEITVDSTVGVGSVFRVMLPAASSRRASIEGAHPLRAGRTP